jgi:hypothetical protein
LPAQRFGARNGRSGFGHPAAKRRWRARTAKTSRPFGCPSYPIKANQSRSNPTTRARRADAAHLLAFPAHGGVVFEAKKDEVSWT